ncbi:MAG: class I SAM-dependent methyltransferase [Deltaproteobacteria bacterium]|nr:class I SAM-dependent methyltransferase [Deltaproteobacteria bacterium]
MNRPEDRPSRTSPDVQFSGRTPGGAIGRATGRTADGAVNLADGRIDNRTGDRIDDRADGRVDNRADGRIDDRVDNLTNQVVGDEAVADKTGVPPSQKAKPAADDPYGPLRRVTGSTLRPGGLELTKRALSFCRFPQGASLLDAGCGQGATLELLLASGFKAVGLDADPAQAAQAAQAAQKAETRIGFLEDLPFADASFDGLFCECVLNLTDRERALREIARTLKPGGFFILSDIFKKGGTLELPAAKQPEPKKNLLASSGTSLPTGSAAPSGTDRPVRSGFRSDGPAGEASSRPPDCRQGALTIREMLTQLENLSLVVDLVEDHQKALDSLAAALVWEYGAKGYAQLLGLGGCLEAGSKEKFTYALVVARK